MESDYDSAEETIAESPTPKKRKVGENSKMSYHNTNKERRPPTPTPSPQHSPQRRSPPHSLPPAQRQQPAQGALNPPENGNNNGDRPEKFKIFNNKVS